MGCAISLELRKNARLEGGQREFDLKCQASLIFERVTSLCPGLSDVVGRSVGWLVGRSVIVYTFSSLFSYFISQGQVLHNPYRLSSYINFISVSDAFLLPAFFPIGPSILPSSSPSPEVGNYKRKILRKKERKHALDQEKKKDNTLTTKEKSKKPGSRPRYRPRKKKQVL